MHEYPGRRRQEPAACGVAHLAPFVGGCIMRSHISSSGKVQRARKVKAKLLAVFPVAHCVRLRVAPMLAFGYAVASPKSANGPRSHLELRLVEPSLNPRHQ